MQEEQDLVASNDLKLHIANFSGPLDLLLHLVKENKIEIKDIFVSEVTEQFMEYMTEIDSLDVDKAAEYMATAATLIEIKSHALLPKMPDLDDDDTPEKSLIRQLEEYKMFKEVCTELKQQENVDRFYREAEVIPPKDVLHVKDGFDMNGFMDALNKFLLKMQVKMMEDKTSKAIVKDVYTVKDRVARIVGRLRQMDEFCFFDLFDDKSTKSEIITTFIAVLEMLKLQEIKVVQKEDCGEFTIMRSCDFSNLTEEQIYDSIG